MRVPFVWMAALGVSSLAASPGAALAQEASEEAKEEQTVPQRHELEAALDVLIERELSGGNARLRYTFLAQSLDRVDPDVVPVLRRFLYHPNAIWLQVHRFTTQLEQVTGVGLGGNLSFGRGIVTLDAQVGFENVDVKQDPLEPGYLSAPYRVELQTHALPRTRLGAYFRGRPVLKATSDRVINSPTTRDGGEIELGATAAGASCGDRLYGEISAGWKSYDWTFVGTFAGDLTASGPTATALGQYQLSTSSSVGLRVDFESLQWESTREDDADRIEGILDPRAMRLGATLEFTYWYRGTYGIKVQLGGGLQQRRPIFDDETNGFGHFGFAITSRF